MALLTGIVYPLLITLVAQLTMPLKANGSLIKKEGLIIGSELLAQKIVDDRYFQARPSAIDYDPLKPSGGSNLGPTSKELQQKVVEGRKQLGAVAPADLLYASGSGLDPHIRVMSAYFQVSRIAKARLIDEKKLIQLVDSMVEGRQLGFLGPRYVNVMRLNKELDELSQKK